MFAAAYGCPLCFLFFEKAKVLTNTRWQGIEPDEPLRVQADAESLAPFVGAPRNETALKADEKEKNHPGIINQLHIFGLSRLTAQDIVTLEIVACPGDYPKPLLMKLTLT